MRRVLSPRIAALFGLAALYGSAGCTHNHYYYGNGVPVCPQPADVTTYHFGEVCEVPSQVAGGTVITQAPARPTVIASTPRSSILFSQPLGSRFAWHRPDPEALATTRVEGGLDDSDTVAR